MKNRIFHTAICASTKLPDFGKGMAINMSIMEICLLIIGGIVFVVSFLIPDKKSSGIGDKDKQLGTEQIQKMIDQQMKDSKKKLEGVVEETLDYAVEKTERAVERISNEKIMAVNEYSDTVLEEINKNHQEVMFLYDMLNDKHKNIKNAAIEVDKTVKAAAEKAKETEERLQKATVPATGKTAIEILREQQNQSQKAVDQERQDDAPITKEQQADTTDSSSAKIPQSKAAEQMIEALGAKRISMDKKKTEDQKNAETKKKPESKKNITEKKEKNEKKEMAFAPLTLEKVLGQEHVLDTFEETIEKQEAEERAIQQFQDLSNAMPVMEQKKSTAVPTPQEQVQKVNIQFMPGNDGGKNSNERILALYKEGKSNIAIAKELGLGVGEVNLVINLYKGSH